MKASQVESIAVRPFCLNPAEIEAMQNPFCLLQAELAQGLALFWQSAGEMLADSGIRLTIPESHSFSLERNFFTALFLYSYFRSRIPQDRRVLYTAVNQCLRGMVTGCDNLLDDEYKMTLDTDLPLTGTRFRSVLDIMVSERVLFDIMLERLERHEFDFDVVRKAVRASLKALARSGSQESSEQAGIAERRLAPDEILSTVHHFKTGLLFQCPWAVPGVIENPLPTAASTVKDALYRIGIGCQIMDDIVDLVSDVRNRRHNYVASLIAWGDDAVLKRLLSQMASSTSGAFYMEAFGEYLRKAYQLAMDYLQSGLRRLFFEDHQGLVDPSAAFLAERIGAARILRTGT